MIRTVFTFVLLAALSTSAVAAEQIRLRDGSDVVGVIESRKDGVLKVRTEKGVVAVSEKDVVAIARIPGTAEEERKKETVEASSRAKPKENEKTERARVVLEEDDPRAEAVNTLLAALVHEKHETRAGAVEMIVELWPESAFALDVALDHDKENVRKAAIRLLRDERLGDQSVRLKRKLSDSAPRVVIEALRAIRSLGLHQFEMDVLRLLDSNAEWLVRQDAARTLERIGGERAFPLVVALWSVEPDEHRKRRFKRVMREIARCDLGDDAKAWQEAVSEVFLGKRDVRDPATAGKR